MPTPVLITSIQAPTPAVRAWLATGSPVTIVGDRKSPEAEAYRLPGLRFLSLEEQRAGGGSLVGLLPENSYARKNLGYLQMAAERVPVFIETDDDNAPLGGWEETLLNPGTVAREPSLESSSGWAPVNVYGLFGQPAVWPRGFPLRRLRSPVSEWVERLTPERPWVVQGLANGEPDVDAIYRLVFPAQSITFAAGAPVKLGPRQWCPFNSQNTLWRAPGYALAYLPFTVSMRFTDILRGYVAQVCMQAAGQALVFTGASVVQDRNPHDALDDFAGEIGFYLRGEEIVERLSRLGLGGDPAADLLVCYRELAAAGVVETAELAGVAAYLDDLARFVR